MARRGRNEDDGMDLDDAVEEAREAERIAASPISFEELQLAHFYAEAAEWALEMAKVKVKEAKVEVEDKNNELRKALRRVKNNPGVAAIQPERLRRVGG